VVARLPGVASLRKYTLAFRLTSELADLQAGHENPIRRKNTPTELKLRYQVYQKDKGAVSNAF
jgi:hypothetical protein